MEGILEAYGLLVHCTDGLLGSIFQLRVPGDFPWEFAGVQRRMKE